MAWSAILEEDVLDRLNDVEGYAYENQDSEGGIKSEKLAAIIAQVSRYIRGRIASCNRNTSFGTGDTLPPETHYHAIALIRHALVASLPSSEPLQGDERDREYDSANRYLDRVASCEESISPDSGGIGTEPTNVCYSSEEKLSFTI